MIVKVNAKGLYKITKSCSLEAMCDIFDARLPRELNIFANIRVGAGFFQWSFPGEDWTRLSDADSVEAADVNERLKEIKKEVGAALSSIPKINVENIFTTPGKEFVFYRYDDGNLLVMLTAWDFKFPVNRLSGPVVVGGAKAPVMQDVVLVFTEAGLPAAGKQVAIKTFSGRNKKVISDESGRFDMGKLRVGKDYSITVPDAGKTVTITPEKDKTEYLIDLTQPVTVEILTRIGGNACQGLEARVEIDGSEQTVVTDAFGKASLTTAFKPDLMCRVCVKEQEQSSMLSYPVTVFSFDFEQENPIVEKPLVVPHPGIVNEEKKQDVNVYVVTGNNTPAPNYPLHVDIGGDSYGGSTDGGGYFKLGKHQVNRQIRITDANNYNNTESYIVTEGESVYRFTIADDEEARLLFSAYDSNGNPLSGRVIRMSQDGKDATLYLDQSGKATLSHNIFECGKDINSSLLEGGIRRADFQFTLDPYEYEYRLEFSETISHDWKRILLNILLVLLLTVLVVFGWSMLLGLTL